VDIEITVYRKDLMKRHKDKQIHKIELCDFNNKHVPFKYFISARKVTFIDDNDDRRTRVIKPDAYYYTKDTFNIRN
jgi:hypothetical protein